MKYKQIKLLLIAILSYSSLSWAPPTNIVSSEEHAAIREVIKKNINLIINSVKNNAVCELENHLYSTKPELLTEVIEPKNNSTLLHWVLASNNGAAIRLMFDYAVKKYPAALECKNNFQLSPLDMLGMLATKNKITLINYLDELEKIESE